MYCIVVIYGSRPGSISMYSSPGQMHTKSRGAVIKNSSIKTKLWSGALFQPLINLSWCKITEEKSHGPVAICIPRQPAVTAESWKMNPPLLVHPSIHPLGAIANATDCSRMAAGAGKERYFFATRALWAVCAFVSLRGLIPIDVCKWAADFHSAKRPFETWFIIRVGDPFCCFEH